MHLLCVIHDTQCIGDTRHIQCICVLTPYIALASLCLNVCLYIHTHKYVCVGVCVCVRVRARARVRVCV